MRVVIQRVQSAAVHIDGVLRSSIGRGLLVFVGVEVRDGAADVEWIAHKIAAMRLFDDDDGVMNLPVTSLSDGEILVVSQFTLMASTKKSNRPSYVKASRPEHAVPMYRLFCEKLSQLIGKQVATGVFGANMQVSLVNDGPVTIVMDSHLRDVF